MIHLQKQGFYKLIETHRNVKILYLGDQVFAWVEPKNIGEILVVSHKIHKTDCLLSLGHYRIFKVEDEPGLVDMTHLELDVGHDVWQGYLLPTDLPTDDKKRARIIPTPEIISNNKRYSGRKDLNLNLAFYT